MTSANQMFKNSNSDLPFKEWLKREQLKGKLSVHEDKYLNASAYYNADGDGTDDNKNTWLIPSLIGFALGFAFSHYYLKKK